LFRDLFGIEQRDPLLDLFVHVAFLIAIIFSCRNTLDAYKKDYIMRTRRGRSRRTAASISRTYELRLIITAAVPMLAILIFCGNKTNPGLLLLGVYYVINGIVLFIPDFLLQSNKDAGKMTSIDGALVGLFYSLSVVPGISGIGSGLSACIARGADKTHAYNWLLLLSIPAIVVLCFFDVIAIFSTSISISFLVILSYILAMVGAFLTGCLAVLLMRFLMHHIGYSGFAYYSWGVAMLIFVIYLIT
jgi:undecaprenyl-diphosphatase